MTPERSDAPLATSAYTRQRGGVIQQVVFRSNAATSVLIVHPPGQILFLLHCGERTQRPAGQAHRADQPQRLGATPAMPKGSNLSTNNLHQGNGEQQHQQADKPHGREPLGQRGNQPHRWHWRNLVPPPSSNVPYGTQVLLRTESPWPQCNRGWCEMHQKELPYLL